MIRKRAGKKSKPRPQGEYARSVREAIIEDGGSVMFGMESLTEQQIAGAEAAFHRGSEGRLSFIGMEQREGLLHVAAEIIDGGRLWMKLITVDIGDDLSAAVMEAGRLALAYAERDFYKCAVH
jgi:hypothetical protein